MTAHTERPLRFRFSLRWLLFSLLILGVGFGVLGRLFRQSPFLFSAVVSGLSTVGPVALGEHELTLEFACAYVDKSKLIGLDANSLPVNRWPNAAKRWKQTVTAPLQVFTADETLVKLSTDPNLDPRAGITVKRCVVQMQNGGKKKVILEMEISGAIAMSCDVSITLGGKTVALGSRWAASNENGSVAGGSALSAVIESLDPIIEYADFTLTPAPQQIESRSDVSEIWGQPILLHSIPVERLDLELEHPSE
ncbi:MAG: hypothetical protein H6822_01280 [Planctomycetaceae bacterium]|nr:hypothetical protein [Planctomycetales bacterium]MCB9920778.1 hypothetical protein [Planctomycetaceae bacterium]